MANVNVRKRLERISRDLEVVGKQVTMYSGISVKDARYIDTLATGIAEQAAMVAEKARLTQGDLSARMLVLNVRKALGFTYP